MIRPAAVHIIQTLREHGHVAYLAGGCVRDRLLGLTPKDHDVATDAPPDVVQKLFRRSQPVGEAFGVVLVYPHRKFNPRPPQSKTHSGGGGSGIEVATFRTEGIYSDGRHPDAVTFSDAQHDAQRRDFTINGLFESPGELNLLAGDRRSPGPPEVKTKTLDDGSIILDHVGGLVDLETKTLRAIGDPDRRFAEDYLRMLRAARFTTRLGFTLDPTTAQAIRNLAKLLSQISRERIGGEVRLMLTHPRFANAAALLQQLRLDSPALNEDRLDQPLPTLNNLSPEAGYAAKLAAWMIDRHGLDHASPVKIKRWRQALCLSNDDTDTLGRIFRQLVAAHDWPAMTVAARKRLATSTDWNQTLYLLGALDRADSIVSDTRELQADGIGLAPPPFIDGRDLIDLGLKPGPHFKPLLDRAYDAQLEGRIADRDAALAWVKEQAKPA